MRARRRSLRTLCRGSPGRSRLTVRDPIPADFIRACTQRFTIRDNRRYIMIRLIVGTRLPSRKSSILRRTLSDPDQLAAISDQFAREPSTDVALADKFSRVLHDLCMGGVWKTTNRGRLPTTERAICAHLKADSGGDISVLDLGASDGTTSLDLANALRSAFGDRIRVVMADLNLSLHRYHKGPLVEYRTANGKPVMARIGRIGLQLADHGHSKTTNPLAVCYRKCQALRKSMRFDFLISLIHPLVLAEPSVQTIELDCLERQKHLSNKFHCVRASNLLNCDYFPDNDIRIAVANIYDYLREGGCLLVSRNIGGSLGESENGSIWRKSGPRFIHLADFGAGSEIKTVVNRWTAL